ncbi:hypothetical protein BJX68DRAFT_269336 [Aspergillus pseudodeflectus]|uniref:F-box domain-containing protein n=1 Tax=Aspergillus pseudodeflectus TaxID=176178 RepID=A0ABR4JYK0_9EURO
MSKDGPFRTPTLKELRSLAEDIPGSCANPKYSVGVDAGLRDCFARFPLELREEIATHLTTGDYFNLRLASRMMATAFHDVRFWKSRFREQGCRGFWSDIAADRGADSQVDWAMVYHATSRLRSRLEFTMTVWDIVSWIRSALVAVDRPSLKPLDFAGRALQEYRGDETVGGDRIVRTRVSSRLAGIAISYSCSPRPTKACEYGNVIHTLKIFALEFQYRNGDTVVAGTLQPETIQQWPDNEKETPSLCDCFRGRLVFDATAFAGLCAHYHSDETIASLGVLQQGKEPPTTLAGGPRVTPLF